MSPIPLWKRVRIRTSKMKPTRGSEKVRCRRELVPVQTVGRARKTCQAQTQRNGTKIWTRETPYLHADAYNALAGRKESVMICALWKWSANGALDMHG